MPLRVTWAKVLVVSRRAPPLPAASRCRRRWGRLVMARTRSAEATMAGRWTTRWTGQINPVRRILRPRPGGLTVKVEQRIGRPGPSLPAA